VAARHARLAGAVFGFAAPQSARELQRDKIDLQVEELEPQPLQ
jgi:hypothetical protein